MNTPGKGESIGDVGGRWGVFARLLFELTTAETRPCGRVYFGDCFASALASVRWLFKGDHVSRTDVTIA
jgi:hypothetical protein